MVLYDSGKFLEGDAASMLTVAAFPVSAIGMKQYVYKALIVLWRICVANIISLKSRLMLHILSESFCSHPLIILLLKILWNNLNYSSTVWVTNNLRYTTLRERN